MISSDWNNPKSGSAAKAYIEIRALKPKILNMKPLIEDDCIVAMATLSLSTKILLHSFYSLD